MIERERKKREGGREDVDYRGTEDRDSGAGGTR